MRIDIDHAVWNRPLTFALHRDVDETGLSGTGVVAHGALFPNGKVVLAWGGSLGVPSVAVFDNVDQVRTVHGHDGKTRLVWDMP